MRIILLPLLLFFSVFHLAVDLHGQQNIKGTVSEYAGEAADIVTGFMNPKKIGSMQPDGTFEIVFPENYAAALIAAVENQDKSDGFTMRLRMVDDAFGNCSDGTIAIENGDQPVINLTTQKSFMIADYDKQQQYGYMIASNSREHAKSMMTYEHGKEKKGYYLDWYYFDEPTTVKGECSIKSYTLTQTEEDAYTATTTYDLNFKKGWNIVKYEYRTIYTDSENKTYADTILFETLKKMPKDAEFFYFAN